MANPKDDPHIAQQIIERRRLALIGMSILAKWRCLRDARGWAVLAEELFNGIFAWPLDHAEELLAAAELLERGETTAYQAP